MSLDSVKILAQLDDTERELNQNKRGLSHVESKIAVVREALTKAELEMQQKEEAYQEIETEFQSIKKQLDENTLILQKMEKQIMQIRNQKEFIASKMQVKEIRKKCNQLEDNYLDYEEKRDQLKSDLDSVKSEVMEQQKLFEASSQDLQDQSKNIKQAIDQNTEEYAATLLQLEPKLHNFYKRSIERGIEPVFCRIIDTSCTGCNTELLPQLLNELRTQPDSYRSCPFCFRIIYIYE